jgi:RNA polymerase sigma-70 factor (ECF subfamily)
MGVRGTLADSQGRLISGLRIHKVEWAEAMEDEREKAAAQPAPPEDTFGERFEAERGDIERVCYRVLDDPAAAEDATSEVFLRARRALSSYDPEQPFRPWLRAIASNFCIDQLRRQKTERKLFSRADLSEEGLVDASPDVLGCLTRSEERRQVLAAIDALPANYRLPLVLRFYRDLDYEAIADLLNITRNQVGSLLFRAKKQLRERLAQGIDDNAMDASESSSELAKRDPDAKPRRRRRARSLSSATSNYTTSNNTTSNNTKKNPRSERR